MHHYAAPAGLDLSCPNPSHPQEPWCLLDVCFGLGYGTWASLARQAALTQAAPPIQVLAFEMDGNLNQAWHPVARSLEHRFPPGRALSLEIDPTGPGYQITARTGDRIAAHIEVRICDFRQQLAQLELSVDRVFHDAFSPRLVPELWTVETMGEYARLLKKRKGKLLTYSSAAAVLGALRSTGFHLYRTPALGSKTGGTLACLEPLREPLPQGIALLPPQDLELLATRSGLPYRDPTRAADAHQVQSTRNAEQRASPLQGRIDLKRPES